MAVDENEIVHRLYSHGMSIQEIADITDIPSTTIRSVLTTIERPIPTEEELHEKDARLKQLAYDEAFKMLRGGTAATKINLIRAIVSATSRQTSGDASSKFQDLRLALEGLMEQNRSGVGGTSPQPELVIPLDTSTNASESNSPLSKLNDPDQGSNP